MRRSGRPNGGMGEGGSHLLGEARRHARRLGPLRVKRLPEHARGGGVLLAERLQACLWMRGEGQRPGCE